MIDGAWSEWSEWSCGKVTSQGCGSSPLQVRERTCTAPTPLNGGADCPLMDPEEETKAEACELGACTCSDLVNEKTCNRYKGLSSCSPLSSFYTDMKKYCITTCGICNGKPINFGYYALKDSTNFTFFFPF